ncbi:MAG: LPP20 family lipoprotein [Bacteroidota bacterium]
MPNSFFHGRFPVILLILGVLMFSCTGKKNIVAVPENSKPGWVKNYPIDPGYYTGVASAPLHPFNTNHIAQARDAALSEIAASITVQIVSESESTIREDNLFFSQSFEERITSFAKQQLEGYELVDTWEGDNQYWVYYRLSKAEYQRQLQNKMQRAEDISSDLVEKANLQIKENNLNLAISYYLQAFSALSEFAGYGIESEIEQQKVILDNYIYQNVQNLFSGLMIVPEKNIVEAEFLKGLGGPVRVFVYSSDTNSNNRKPVSSFPVKAGFASGNGSLVEEYNTGNDGAFFLRVSKVTNPSIHQTIVLKPDLKRFEDLYAAQTPVLELINGFDMPESKITLQIKPVVVCLDFSGEGRNIRGSYSNKVAGAAEGTLRSSLSDKGFRFTDNRNACQYIIKMDAKTRNGTIMQDIHTAFCDASLYVLDNNHEELAGFSVSNIAGADLSFDRAQRKSIGNATENLLKKLEKQWFEDDPIK